MSSPKTTRRRFLQSTAAGVASIPVLGAGSEASGGSQVSPNDRIRIATVGLGQQGTSDTRSALRQPGVELVGVADLYRGRRIRAKEVFGDSITTTDDYRELISRGDVDAVIVATSDHWHATICIEAMEAGKDVYCQKPMVHALPEGHRMIECERRTGRILQVGSQRTSSPLYRKARALLAAGAVGEPILIEAWYHRSSTNGAWQYVIPPDSSPSTVNWEAFLGKAPARPFDADRFFRWRNYWDYGTGIPGDLFVHLLTGVHFITDSPGPNRVTADGGLRYWRDGREVPDLMMGLYRYPETETHPAFNLSLTVNFADLDQDSGLRIVGSEAIMTLGRSGLTLTKRPRDRDIRPSIITFPEAMQMELLAAHEEAGEPVTVNEKSESYGSVGGAGGNDAHLATFLSAVRSRRPALQDSTFGFRAAAPALLANRSYLEGRAVAWDPVAMEASQEESR